MPDGRHARIERLFQKAAELPPADRRAFLESECDDAEVRGEVEKLLAYDEVQGGGLTGPLDDRLLPTRDLQQSAPGRGNVPLGVSPSGASTDAIDHGRFLPGTVLAGRFRIVGMLGKGGMGEVYRADDLELGQSVALKFLPKKLANDPRSLERFRGEVRLARQVSHPNVCRVYDISQIDGELFLSMEYVDGEDLAQLLRRIGRFPADRAATLARQLCLGLHAAHEKGVLHRDLKPANIMIDGRGKLLVTDFGLAEVADEVRAEDIRAGTPAYMAPEQLAGREVSERSDIFSLGMLLHEIYTGQPVWQADSLTELIAKRKDSSGQPPSSHHADLDPVVESVIQRCLEPDPQRRPSSALRVLAGLPGGDPLQAALAAGELPSPEMIADSGEEGRLSLATGSALFALLCILFVAIPFVSDALGRFEFGGLAENKPAVLEKTARDFVSAMGYDAELSSTASGFNNSEAGHFEYWYRQSAAGLKLDRLLLWGNATTWQISLGNPRTVLPGMRTIRLSNDGEVLEFLAIPQMSSRGVSEETSIDWQETLQRAGLDMDGYEAVFNPPQDLIVRPPIYADHVSYWRKGEDDSSAASFVVMAAQAGNLTYFCRAEDGRLGPLGRQLDNAPLGHTVSAVLILIIVILGVGFALCNMKLARIDLRSAVKCSIFILCCDLIAWIFLRGSLVRLFSDAELTANYLIRTLALSLRAGIFYIAFEPVIRRYWPNSLVTWMRIQSGRFRDPLVGRDLITGCLLAIALFAIAPTFWDGRADDELSANRVMIGPAIGTALSTQAYVINTSLGATALLVLFRILSRSTLAAAAIYVLVMSFFIGPDDPSIVRWLAMVGFWTCVAFSYVRFGLVTTIVAMSVFLELSRTPLTTNLADWYSASTMLVVGSLCVVAGFGYYCSTIAPLLTSRRVG